MLNDPPSRVEAKRQPIPHRQPLLAGAFVTLIAFGALSARVPYKVSSGIDEEGVALSFEIDEVKYPKRGTVSARYTVTNRRARDIYLVIPDEQEERLGYDPDRRKVFIDLDKRVPTYHVFELPQMVKVAPRKSYAGHAAASLASLDQRISGRWLLLYLSIGYLDATDFRQIRSLLEPLRRQELPEAFDHAQRILVAGPIEIERAD